MALLSLPGAIPVAAAPVPAAPRPAGAETPVWSVPIQITNSQLAATGTYQQMVVVNSSRYSAYINANESNVEFRYANGTAIESWLESNASNTSTRTTWWLRLFNIPANSTVTVYLDVYSEASSLFSVYGPSGEAPQLSATYGGLDDGARVFTDYWNWSGASFPSGWSSAAATINNGLNLTGGNWQASIIDALYRPVAGQTIDVRFNAHTTYFAFGLGNSSSDNNRSFFEDRAPDPTPGDWSCEGCYVSSQIVPPYPKENVWYVLSLTANPFGTNSSMTVNYTTIVLRGDLHNPTGTHTTIGQSDFAMGAFGSYATVNWTRVRVTPPSGVMPTATFVPPPAPIGFVVTSSSDSALTLGWSNGGSATNDTLYWGPNCSALRPFNTSLYPEGSLGVRSNLTLFDLPSGAAFCFALSSWNYTAQSAWTYAQGATAVLSATLGGGTPPLAAGTLLLVVLIMALSLTVAFVALPALFGERRKSKSKPTRIPAGRSR